VKLGAYDFIEKPPSIERILHAAGNALDRERLANENRRLTEESGAADEILGSADATRELRQTLSRVAPTEATVLLLGENGTGKELAARAIHTGSARAKKPLVVVNCAAIPESLFESELFGHVRGAFTGATEARRGKFQQADGGTLFLDEIGETPRHLQSKLLRALESGDVETIGGRGPERVDVRLIAATNRDLQAESAAGTFRPDLYYRLAVLPVRLPPLRERAADVPALAAHFLDAACRRNRVRPKRLDPDAIEGLARHRWPGNVRELRNAMERVAILVSRERVGFSDLTFLEPPPSAGPGLADEAGGDLASMMERHERALVTAALARNHWKMTRTAEELGLERSHLYKKLKALGIERPVED
jgi:two-component system, NtrC family, nitrogen regulation response regulator NtrX